MGTIGLPSLLGSTVRRVYRDLYRFQINPNTIHILGAGSVGQLVAYALRQRAESNTTVNLLLHEQSSVDEFNKNKSIKVWFRAEDETLGCDQGVGAEYIGNGPTEEKVGENQGIIENLIVATKTFATSGGFNLIKHRITRETRILFIQNGIGVIPEIMDRHFPNVTERPICFAGISTHGVAKGEERFHVRLNGRGSLKIGQVPTRPDEVIIMKRRAMLENPLIGKLLHSPLLKAEYVSPRVLREEQFRKLMINVVINPLTALFDCTNGELFDENFPERELIARQLVVEAAAVGRVLLAEEYGARVDPRWSQNLLEKVKELAELTRHNTSSMLQDVRAGRPTEIKYLNEYIVQEAVARGLECPAHKAVMYLFRWMPYSMGASAAEILPFFQGKIPE